jgi:Zn-dependent alcohol dehydrogenase
MPTRSKAAILVTPNAPLVIDQVTFPDPQPDQVLIKLFASGICYSQLHQIHRTPQTTHRGTPAVYPSLLGHEATGVVVAKGHQVTHMQEGDHVMTTWVDRRAVEGAPPRAPVHVQWHGQAVPAGPATWTEYTLLSERLVVPLDKEVATDVTSIIGCAVLTGAGVILNTLGVRVNESVAVFGAGGVGLCAIAAAQIVGAYPIIAVDLSDDKLAFAQRFGATHGVNAARDDPVQAIEAMRIHSVATLTGDRTALVTTHPCRAAHHTISDAGLIGGGQVPIPGEVSLAYYGNLLLDELPEFKRHVLEVLRQPLEDGLLS